jgi:hypothetical protein
MSYEHLTVELPRIEVVWDITLCKLGNSYRRFEGPKCHQWFYLVNAVRRFETSVFIDH